VITIAVRRGRAPFLASIGSLCRTILEAGFRRYWRNDTAGDFHFTFSADWNPDRAGLICLSARTAAWRGRCAGQRGNGGASSGRSVTAGEGNPAAYLPHPVSAAAHAGVCGGEFCGRDISHLDAQFPGKEIQFFSQCSGFECTIYIHLASAVAVPVAGWLATGWRAAYRGGRMAVQAGGLIVGSVFVFLVGRTSSVTTLVLAMTVFGLCKGFYDSGIFASLYDSVEPRARGTVSGLMNTVGWAGGALGPLFVGLASKYGGKPTAVENMSDAMPFAD